MRVRRERKEGATLQAIADGLNRDKWHRSGGSVGTLERADGGG